MRMRPRFVHRLAAALLALPALLLSGPVASAVGADVRPVGSGAQVEPVASPASAPQVVPVPVSMTSSAGTPFTLSRKSRIVAAGGGHAGTLTTAKQLAAILRPSTGYALPVTSSRHTKDGDIVLSLGHDPALGAEGYRLDVRRDTVRLRAGTSAGLFYGVQTLRQLLPPWIESPTERPAPWTIAPVQITDYPRYEYRGVMLDIARHFEPPEAVKRLIDDASAFKINRLHLHVSDDQGFRIAIDGRPELTDIGSQFSVNNDPGGFWTQAEFADVVAYANAHHMTVIPEVDTPGHTNAIIMSYNTGPEPTYPVLPDINCSANDPPVWNLTFAVGYSALCPDSDNTWSILTDVSQQLGALSGGSVYHLGGDEVPSSLLSDEQYNAFVDRESQILKAQGRTVMGWADISSAGFDAPGAPPAIAQFWSNGNPTGSGGNTARVAVSKGMKVVMSPANHAYLDMKQFPDSPLGLSWAGVLDVSHFYHWSGTTSDPATYIPERTSGGVTLPAVTDAHILGVEAPMWSETLKTIDDIEFQAFPRLPATAEIGWSPVYNPATAPDRTLASFQDRVAARGTAWQVRKQNFYASPQVPWRVDLSAPDLRSDRDFSGAVATVAAPGAPLAELSATVDWGDGTTSDATVSGTQASPTSINSLYAVNGSHTYARSGTYHAQVTVTRDGLPATEHFLVRARGH